MRGDPGRERVPCRGGVREVVVVVVVVMMKVVVIDGSGG